MTIVGRYQELTGAALSAGGGMTNGVISGRVPCASVERHDAVARLVHTRSVHAAGPYRCPSTLGEHVDGADRALGNCAPDRVAFEDADEPADDAWALVRAELAGIELLRA